MLPGANALMRLFRRTAASEGVANAVHGRVRMQVEEVEPRILHSADFAPVAFGDVTGAQVQMRVLDATPAAAVQSTATQEARRHELVIVDTATADYQQLVDDIVAQGSERVFDVVLIERESDGIARITDALARLRNVDAVHVISHGSEGTIHLGSSVLDLNALRERAAEIEAWSNALTANADLLIYGCDVAASPDGRLLVDALARVTGADVAASDDATGNVALGGDWNLEYQAGGIETPLALSQAATNEWIGLLDIASLQSTQDSYIKLKSPDNSNNFGASTQLIVDRESSDLQRALLQFDLSSVPANATINSATLRMQATQVGGALNINVYEMLESWSEGTGNGTTGATNWSERTSGTNWSTAGGSFNSTAVATLNTNATGQHSWDITALVQSWVNGTKVNNGVMVASPDGGGNRTATYDSREGTNAPILVIDYTLGTDTVVHSYDVPLAQLDRNELKSSQSWGQTFRHDSAGATYAVDKIGLVLHREDDATPGQTITVSLRSTWNGAVIASGSVSGDALATSEAWLSVSLTSAAILNDNQVYFIRADSDGDGKVYVGVDDSGNYATGDLINKDGNTENGKDMAFRIVDTLSTVAPVLSGANNLTAINEDAATNGGTLVSNLIAGQVTDADPGALAGIAVTGVDNANGVWQYSTNGGTSWNNFGAPSGSSARLLAADANTYVRFVPNANWNGTVGNGLTFRAWDQTSGTAGGAADTSVNGGATAFSSATASSSITVNAVNDAPAGTSNTVTTNEDTAYVFSAAAFGFTDPSDSPANSLNAVKITTLPGAGLLTLSGAAVSAGQSISAVDIAAGYFVFTPASNANGAGYASFTFQVQDDGGGSANLDPVARTMTVNVSAVNDAPVNTMPAAQSTALNTPVVFSAGAGNAIVVSDPDAGGAALEVTLGATNGVLTLGATTGLTFSVGTGSGNASMTFTGTAVDINLALNGLRFDPTAAFSGAAQIDITTSDLGNTGSGGARSTTNALPINVAFVNTAPVLTGVNSLDPINEDSFANTGTLVSDLIAGTVSDPNAGALAGIAVTAVVNTNGVWQYSMNSGGSWSAFGAPGAASARLLAADANTYVRFVPNANWNGTVTNGLTFRAWDQTSGTAGGTKDTTAATFTVRDNFGAVSYGNNDGTAIWSTSWVDSDANPSSGNIQVTGGALVLSTFLGSDSIYREFDLSGATSATLSFSYDNQLGTLGTVTVQASINGGASYTTLTTFGSEGGSGTISFAGANIALGNTRIKLQMDGTVVGGSFAADNVQISYVKPLNGGETAFSSATASSSITVSPVNDRPVGTSNTVVTLEETPLTFNAAAFGFTDPNDTPANNLLAVRIATLPSAGALTLSGAAVSAGQFVSAADINAGNLVFTPAANTNGAGYASFTFQVQDNGGTANGGVDLDTTARAMTVNVTPVNDAPVGTSSTVTTNEDTPLVFNAAAFGFTDPSDTPASNLLAVRIASLPAAGALTLSGAAVAAGQFVSLADINAGNLVFTPAANASGAAYASFTFQVRDSGGTANGGVDLDPIARRMTINVTAINDAPVGTNNTQTAAEDTPFAFNSAAFGFTDPNDAPANNLRAVRITSLPTPGSLTLSGAAVTAGQFVSVADIAAGRLVYAPGANGNGAGYASFTFQVQDDGGGPVTGGVDLDVIARAFTIDVTAVNDPPVGTDTTLTTVKNTNLVVNTGAFGFTDPSDTPANQLLAVEATSLPNAGRLTLSNVAVAAGDLISAANIAAGNLVYVPATDAVGTAYASFTFKVKDDGGGADLDAVVRTIRIDITPPPVAQVEMVETVVATPPPAAVGTRSTPAPAAAPATQASTENVTEVPAPPLPPPAPREAEPQGVGATVDSAATGSVQGVQRRDTQQQPSRENRSPATALLTETDTLAAVTERTSESTFTLASAQTRTSEAAAAPTPVNREMMEQMDRMRDHLLEQTNVEAGTIAAASATSLGLSVGYVIWLLRGGVLLSTLLSSVPAWRFVDPLPVLGRFDDDDMDETDDSLESLVAQNADATDEQAENAVTTAAPETATT